VNTHTHSHTHTHARTHTHLFTHPPTHTHAHTLLPTQRGQITTPQPPRTHILHTPQTVFVRPISAAHASEHTPTHLPSAQGDDIVATRHTSAVHTPVDANTHPLPRAMIGDVMAECLSTSQRNR